MEVEQLFISKIYYQIYTFLKIKGYDLKNLTDEKAADCFLDAKEYIKNLNREDINEVKHHLPKELINDDIPDLNTVKNIIKIISDYNKCYINYSYNYGKKLFDALDLEYHKKEFEGVYPRYFYRDDKDLIVVEYDNDVFINQGAINATRYAVIAKIKDYETNYPNFNIDDYSYLDLYENRLSFLQDGIIKTFVMHLPDRDCSIEISDESVEIDLKYLEIVENVKNKGKYLPKWYINYNKTQKQIFKSMFLISLIGVLVILSFINFIFFKGNIQTLIPIWLVGGILTYTICHNISLHLYKKYHNILKKEKDI